MRLVRTTEEKIIPSNKNLISIEDMDNWIYAAKIGYRILEFLNKGLIIIL
jgi:hypothetical protein